MESSSGSGISLVFYETASVMLQVVSVIFNVAIICTLSKKSLMRCTSNKFVFSLCMSHLVVSILSLLISAIQFFIIPEIHGSSTDYSDGISYLLDTQSAESSTSYILTHFVMYLTLTAVIGTSINVALISVERYITIAHPMRYKSIVTSARCTAMILICWTLPFLAVLLPALLNGNQTVLHGSFAMPSGRLGLFYALLFSCTTFIVLSVMALCYTHIYTIAKAKCQKVQIGHFTSPVSSISSDWPSTAYSSQAEGHPTLVSQFKYSSPAPGTGVQRLSTPISLLQHVLLANLGRNVQPIREPYALAIGDRNVGGKIATLQESVSATNVPPTRLSRSHHTDFHHHHPPLPPPKPKRWKTFLKKNHNSPRKTISTIVILIGSLALTQLPLAFSLFFPTQGFPGFYFCVKHLFPFTSLTNPVLYGFLNRSIRVHLLKLLRVRKRNRGFTITPRNKMNGRKASISSADSHFMKRESSIAIDEEKLGAVISTDTSTSHTLNAVTLIPETPPNPLPRNKTPCCRSTASENKSSLNNSKNCQPTEFQHTFLHAERTDEIERIEENDNFYTSNFPRKPSQDSGVDMAFIDEDDDGDAEESREKV